MLLNDQRVSEEIKKEINENENATYQKACGILRNQY